MLQGLIGVQLNQPPVGPINDQIPHLIHPKLESTGDPVGMLTDWLPELCNTAPDPSDHTLPGGRWPGHSSSSSTCSIHHPDGDQAGV